MRKTLKSGSRYVWQLAATGIMLAVAGTSLPLAAQASPCASPEFRSFDFWVGNWDVASPQGVPQGRNSITVEQNGCAIEERWTSAGGGTGRSLNVYDPVRATWTQLWIGGGAVIRLEGKISPSGTLKSEGQISYFNNKKEKPFRGSWTLLPDNTVQQEFHEFDEATKKWTPWFVGIYRKKL